MAITVLVGSPGVGVEAEVEHQIASTAHIAVILQPAHS